MNINEIPPELLLKIFQYIPHGDLYTEVALVCDYWRELSLSPILWSNVDYTDISENLDHLYIIQEYVKKLSIRAEDFSNVFECRQKKQFSSLKKLKVSNFLTVSEECFKNFIERCPRLKSITFGSDDKFKMKHYITKLSELQLMAVDIEYDIGLDEDVNFMWFLDHPDLGSFLKHQPNLKKLALRGWGKLIDQYTINIILYNLQNLVSFDLSYDSINNGAFSCSNTILNLTHLSLYLSKVNDDDVCHIAKRTKQLKFLDIRFCQVSDKGLCEIAKHCPLLENLRFSPFYDPRRYSESITDLTLLAIAENCLNMRCLSCSDCKNLQDEGVVALVQSCRNLNCIILGDCIQLTDKSLNAIGENSSLLQKAEFTNCPKISADGVYRILKSCSQIRSLRFGNCHGISGLVNIENTLIETVLKDKHWLTYHCHFQELALPFCKNILIEKVLHFTFMCPDLRY